LASVFFSCLKQETAVGVTLSHRLLGRGAGKKLSSLAETSSKHKLANFLADAVNDAINFNSVSE